MNENEKHDERESRLCDYLDGRLSRAERKRVEKQLDQDEPLREELRKYAALDGLLGGLAGREIEGVDYDQQRLEIVAAAERKALLGQQGRKRVFFLRPMTGLAAAASLLLLVGVTFWLLSRPDVPDVPRVLNKPPTATAVSVRVVPGAMASMAPPAVVEMRLAQPTNQVMPTTADAGEKMPRGTVVVSSGAVGKRTTNKPNPMMIY